MSELNLIRRVIFSLLSPLAGLARIYYTITPPLSTLIQEIWLDGVVPTNYAMWKFISDTRKPSSCRLAYLHLSQLQAFFSTFCEFIELLWWIRLKWGKNGINLIDRCIQDCWDIKLSYLAVDTKDKGGLTIKPVLISISTSVSHDSGPLPSRMLMSPNQMVQK